MGVTDDERSDYLSNCQLIHTLLVFYYPTHPDYFHRNLSSPADYVDNCNLEDFMESPASTNYLKTAERNMLDGNYGTAIENLTKEIARDPESLIAYRNRGVAKGILGEYEAAMEDLDKALRIDAKDVYAYFNRGNVKKDMGRYEEAMADYNKARQIDEKFAQPHFGLGEVKLKTGKADEAFEHFIEAVHLAKNSNNQKFVDLAQERIKEVLKYKKAS